MTAVETRVHIELKSMESFNDVNGSVRDHDNNSDMNSDINNDINSDIYGYIGRYIHVIWIINWG